MCALKLLVNQQNADNLVDTIFQGLQEQVLRGGHPRSGEDRRRGEELGNQGGQAQVQQGDFYQALPSGKGLMS